MITNVNTKVEFDELAARLKACGEALFDGLRADEDNILIEARSLLAGPGQAGQERVFLLTDGNVPATIDDRVLFYYEPGEIIGLSAAFGVGTLTARCEFAVRANIYPREKTFKKIRKDAARFETLMEYLALESAMLQTMLAATLAASKRPNFQMKHYKPGEIIIMQGADDKDVYSMISGSADVLVDDNQVGRIGEGEVFGEMSRLTGEPRSATVRAHGTCEVMVFGGDDFTTLAETNPTALKEIATNLSQRLAALDKKVSLDGG